MNIIFIDNFDSFSYNLVDELCVLGANVKIFRNNAPVQFIREQLDEASKNGPAALVLSPGPSTPDDAGNLLPIIHDNIGRYPMLGICLGHQAIARALGADIVRAPEIFHGKTSMIEHTAVPIFEGIPNPLHAARYHSLVAANIPESLTVCAETHGLCMAFYSETYKLAGLQFHPESVLTTFGRRILRNCLNFLGS